MAKVAARGTEIFGKPPELTQYNDLQTYEKMSYDSTVRAVLDAINEPIISATYEIQEPTNPSPGEQKITNIMTTMLMENLDFKQIIKTAIKSHIYGFQVFNIIRQPQRISYRKKNAEGKVVNTESQTYVVPRVLEPLPSTTIKQVYGVSRDENGRLIALVQEIDGERIVLPRERLVIITADAYSEYDWRGTSPLAAVHEDWWMKNKFWLLQGITLQKYGPGVDVIELGAEFQNAMVGVAGQTFGQEAITPDEKKFEEEVKKIEEAIEKISKGKANMIITAPGVTYRIEERQDSYPDVLGSIKECQEAIFKRFGANHLILGGSGSSSSNALAVTVSDLFLHSVESRAYSIVDDIQRDLLKRFVIENFGEQERYPKLIVSNINKTKSKILFLAQQYNPWITQFPIVKQGILADLGYDISIEEILEKEEANKMPAPMMNPGGPAEQNNREETENNENNDEEQS